MWHLNVGGSTKNYGSQVDLLDNMIGELSYMVGGTIHSVHKEEQSNTVQSEDQLSLPPL